MATNNIEIKQTVQTGRERVFAALTEAGRLREWFCDWAHTEPRTGGRYTFRWNSGREVQGTFVEIKQPGEVAMIWKGLDEPAQTLVEWRLVERNGGTEVILKQASFDGGSNGHDMYVTVEKSWVAALENLQSVLEEGIDLREFRQPLLGAYVERLDLERGGQQGIATETGAYVIRLVEGGAAETAGVRTGDVIVGVGGQAVSDYDSLIAALGAFHAGDTVEVALVRGQERLTIPATLKARQVPDVPSDPAQVLAQLRQLQARCQVALAELTVKLGEEEAGREPTEGLHSVKHILAHLTLHYQWVKVSIPNIATGLWLEGSTDSSLSPDQITAVLVAEPTVARLLARIARDHEDILRLMEHLSAGTLADRYRYRQIARLVLHGQTEEYIRHLRLTVATLRGQPVPEG